MYVDGIYLKRNWGGEYENVAVLVAIAVNEDGYREILGAAEGMKEDKVSWVNFFQWLHVAPLLAHFLRQVPQESLFPLKDLCIFSHKSVYLTYFSFSVPFSVIPFW